MILVFSFSDILNIGFLPDSFDSDKHVTIENKRYEIMEPIGFGLGFYNYIVSNNRLIGINFQFNDVELELSNFLIGKGYPNIIIDGKDLSIFFESASVYAIDYSQGFLNLYLLKSKEGGFALTINIGDAFDYEVPDTIGDL